jgi:ABC-type sugar transport system permease subunit
MRKRSSWALVAIALVLFLAFVSLYFSYMNVKTLNSSFTGKTSEQATVSLNVKEKLPTSTSPGGGTGGGGGGGGTGPRKIPNFVISPESFNIELVAREVDSRLISVENTGGLGLFIDVSVIGIEDFVSLDTTQVNLGVAETKKVLLTVDAPDPGVYAGKILFSYVGVRREAIVLLNVVSSDVLFDVSVTSLESRRTVKSGSDLSTLVELTRIGEGEGVNVSIKYLIKDFDNNILFTESETLFIEDVKSFNKDFSTYDLKAGDYVVGIELTYPGGFATSSVHFRVTEKVIDYRTWLALWILLIAIILVLIAIYYYRRKNRKKKKIKKLSGKRRKKK